MFYLISEAASINVFHYITFRASCAMMTALIFCYLLYPPYIAWLRRQRMEQIIRKDGPQEHIENKVGTPTMGGVVMLGGITLATLLWGRLDEPRVWMTLIVTLGYGLIGLYDDWKKVMERSADGLAGRWKLLGQVSIAGGTFGTAYLTHVMDARLHFPFYKHLIIDFSALWAGAPDLGWLYIAIAVFIAVGASNAVNLTDGLDGLAIGSTLTSAGTFAVLAYLTGHTAFAEYLHIPSIPGAGELTVFALSIIGAGLGFLWFNAYPAQIFMGDTGSLALGGALATLAILTKHEILLALVGGVFVLETVSVMLQVGYFKWTKGKRLFKMAPIHHHYEKSGWSEPKIIVRFWIISALLALVALTTLKLR